MSMKKAAFLVMASIGFSLLTGCYGGIAYAPAGAPIGLLYNGTTTSKTVSSNAVGSKKGEACGMTILGLITLGDSSAAAAAKAGGVNQISIVDNEDMNILGIYASHCSEVMGN
jgi:hypothetical protein